MYRAASRRGWNVELVLSTEEPRVVAEYFRFFSPVGCIFEASMPACVDRWCRRSAVPCVCLDGRPGRRWHLVEQDPDATAREAAAMLLGLRTENLACAGMPTIAGDWSNRRMDVFREAVAKAGRTVHCFGRRGEFATSTFGAWIRALRGWLRGLPKPCALFAVNDYVGSKAIELCRDAKISVPGDVAVLGVDNDAILCENVAPTLSSIEPDFEQSGAMAVSLVEESLSAPGAEPRRLSFGVRRIVRRRSTLLLAKTGTRVAEAVEFIRLRCKTRLDADGVAKMLGCSRRHADGLFMRALGKSVRDVILDARLACAAEALSRPNCRVSFVAEECGFGSDVSFRRLFAARYGASPKAWSERLRDTETSKVVVQS